MHLNLLTHDKIRGRWQGRMTIAVGLAGTAFSLFAFFLPLGDEKVDPTLPAIIFLLSILLTAVGFDRRDLVEQTLPRLDAMAIAIERSRGGVYLPTWGMVYEVATDLAAGATSEILATGFGRDPDRHKEKKREYYQAIVKTACILRDREDFTLPYKIIIPGRFAARTATGPEGAPIEPNEAAVTPIISAERKEELLRRLELFENESVANSICLFTVASIWGVNLLIVDRCHIVIGFSPPQLPGFMGGLLFRDHPALAVKVAAWFEQLLQTEGAREVKWEEVKKWNPPAERKEG